jgi:hypothetical protein
LEGRDAEGAGCADGRDTEHTLGGKRNQQTEPWEQDWYSVALRTCVRRVDDGIPAGVDGLKLSKSRHRVERLKALGNAIVPQVVMEIMWCIKEIDGATHEPRQL